MKRPYGRVKCHLKARNARPQVGTAMYVAPELAGGAAGAGGAGGYNQKADVYSLGVTLFEMFHAPFVTGAERAAVLAGLRRPEVLLPADFDTAANAKQVYLLRSVAGAYLVISTFNTTEKTTYD
ncbi:Eukaryotic translation initiation factor 2-alpha kinase 4 [Papilio machaon]|uniref:Eukaryotic translation initiation factor 2-alpha kinase 4 n=1 Tax=Papilio machaon TaxID=76193 RepID=A0A194RGS1_PAPMA|nr:Eukaryotic translation initiation factor 2-alpha kinase 4 [Papilio machaon]